MALPVINQNLFMILRTFIAALLAGILIKHSVGATSTVNFSIVFLLHIPEQSGHRFRHYPDSHSAINRTLILR